MAQHSTLQSVGDTHGSPPNFFTLRLLISCGHSAPSLIFCSLFRCSHFVPTSPARVAWLLRDTAADLGGNSLLQSPREATCCKHIDCFAQLQRLRFASGASSLAGFSWRNPVSLLRQQEHQPPIAVPSCDAAWNGGGSCSPCVGSATGRYHCVHSDHKYETRYCTSP